MNDVDTPQTSIAQLIAPQARSDQNVFEALTLFVNNELRDPVLWRDIVAAWNDLHPPIHSRKGRP